MFVYWMKKLLKYILFSIVALAFYNGASADSYCDDISLADIQNEITAIDCFVSSPQTDICIPRQVPTFTSVRLQTSSRRPDNFQRQNFECVKAGKVINAGIRYFVQRNTILTHSSLVEPSHTLITLCRFII